MSAVAGRLRAVYAAETAVKRLNVGCGSHVAAGWVNCDVKREAGVDLVADLRRGLPLEQDSVDYAVSVHALPELSYPELVPALCELRRVLKPGGVLRLVLPDFDRTIDAYRNGDGAFFKVPADELRSAGGRFVAHALWFGYTRSLFTLDFTAELLTKAGFERVCRCAHRQTASPFGRIVELDNRPEESLYLEASKPRPAPARPPHGARGGAQGLEIVEVIPDPGAGVRAHFRVRKGEGCRVAVGGWALGTQTQAREIEVLADGTPAGRAGLVLERPDVAERFPDLAGAARAGFALELLARGRGESELDVFAVLADERREPLGRVVVRAERRGLLGALRRV